MSPQEALLRRKVREWEFLRLKQEPKGTYHFGYGITFTPDFAKPNVLSLRDALNRLGVRPYQMEIVTND